LNDASGKLRNAKRYLEAGFAAESLTIEQRSDLGNCYERMAYVTEPRHGLLLDYWFFESNLFGAMANNYRIYDEGNIYRNQSSYTNDSTNTRLTIRCYQNLLANNKFEPKRDAKVMAQLGVLYITEKNWRQASEQLNFALTHYRTSHGPDHPKARFLSDRLANLPTF